MSIFENAKNKANDHLSSEEGEKKSDELLDKARDAADDQLGVPNTTDAPASEDPQWDDNPQ